MDIFEVIERKLDDLPKKQTMIAEFMRDNPDEMSYITLKDLSRKTEVTEMTILNTCQSLGYQGFNDIKYEFRKAKILSEKTDALEEEYGERIPVYERDKSAKILEEIGNEEVKMITSFWRHINLDDIFKAANMLESKKRIFICGRGVSFYLGEFLSKRMMSCDIFSVCINTELNDDVYGLMECLTKDALILAISFPDYYFMTDKVAQRAKQKGAEVLAITDKKEAEICKVADFILTVPTMTRAFLNTMSGAMLLINILTSALNLNGEN